MTSQRRRVTVSGAVDSTHGDKLHNARETSAETFSLRFPGILQKYQ